MSIFILILLVIVYLLIFGTLIWSALSAAPWLPTHKKDIQALLEQLPINETDRVYDLGCGDGRWLTALAKKTPAKEIIGLEISLLFYVWCRIKFLFSNYPQVKIKYQNLYKENLGQAQVVICFLTPKAMAKLSPKLNQELKAGSYFVTYAFKLPDREPSKIIKITPKSLPIFIYQF